MRTAIRFHLAPPIGRPIIFAAALAVVVALVDGGLFLVGHHSRGDGTDPYRAVALVLLGMGMGAVAILVIRLTGSLCIRAMSRGNGTKPAETGTQIQPSRSYQ